MPNCGFLATAEAEEFADSRQRHRCQYFYVSTWCKGQGSCDTLLRLRCIAELGLAQGSIDLPTAAVSLESDRTAESTARREKSCALVSRP